MDRFAPGEDRQTPYYRQHLRNYPHAVLPFGEVMMWREPGPHKLKLRGNWGYGVWLGRSAGSDSHVVGTRAGVLMCRAVRRLAADARSQQQELLAIRGTPAAVCGPAAPGTPALLPRGGGAGGAPGGAGGAEPASGAEGAAPASGAGEAVPATGAEGVAPSGGADAAPNTGAEELHGKRASDEEMEEQPAAKHARGGDDEELSK